jgi:hypothetical protein
MVDIFNSIDIETCGLIETILKALNNHNSCRILFDTLNQKGIIKLGVANFVYDIINDAIKNGIVEILQRHDKDIRSLARSVNTNKFFIEELKRNINQYLSGCKMICNGQQLFSNIPTRGGPTRGGMNTLKRKKRGGIIRQNDINTLWSFIIIPIVELFEEKMPFINIFTEILSYDNFNKLFLDIKPNIVQYIMNKFTLLLKQYNKIIDLIKMLFIPTKNDPNKFENFVLLDKLLVSDRNIISNSLNTINIPIDQNEKLDIEGLIKSNTSTSKICYNALKLSPTLIWHGTTLITIKKNIKLIKDEFCTINPKMNMCQRR